MEIKITPESEKRMIKTCDAILQSEFPVCSSEVVGLPRSLMEEVLDNLYDLRCERAWWGRVTVPKYEDRWKALNTQIETVEQILNRQTNREETSGST